MALLSFVGALSLSLWLNALSLLSSAAWTMDLSLTGGAPVIIKIVYTLSAVLFVGLIDSGRSSGLSRCTSYQIINSILLCNT